MTQSMKLNKYEDEKLSKVTKERNKARVADEKEPTTKISLLHLAVDIGLEVIKEGEQEIDKWVRKGLKS